MRERIPPAVWYAIEFGGRYAEWYSFLWMLTAPLVLLKPILSVTKWFIFSNPYNGKET